MTKQQSTQERVAETAALIAEARAALEGLHEARGNALLRGDSEAVKASRATMDRVETNLADLITLQARLEVERATEQAEEQKARRAELDQRLQAADLKARATRAGLRDAVAALAGAVNAAREASEAADGIKRELGLTVGHADNVGNLTLGALVECGVVDSRSVSMPANVLRRLAEDPEAHARKVEAERRIKEQAALAFESDPATIRRRLALLRTKLSSYKADMRQGYLKSIAEKITKTEGEIAALEQKLGEIAA